MKLKICGLTEEKNITEIIQETTPDYLGFIFHEPSSRYVVNRLKPGFVQELPGIFRKTGVFVNSPLSYVLKCAKDFNLNTLQLHGMESPEYCQKCKLNGYEIIKAFSIKRTMNMTLIKNYAESCDYFLFDTSGKNRGGNGVKFNWRILDKYTLEKPYFLSGGIGPEDAESISDIGDSRLYGIDINSRFEREPGIKIPDKIKSFNINLKKLEHEKTNLPG